MQFLFVVLLCSAAVLSAPAHSKSANNSLSVYYTCDGPSCTASNIYKAPEYEYCNTHLIPRSSIEYFTPPSETKDFLACPIIDGAYSCGNCENYLTNEDPNACERFYPDEACSLESNRLVKRVNEFDCNHYTAHVTSTEEFYDWDIKASNVISRGQSVQVTNGIAVRDNIHSNGEHHQILRVVNVQKPKLHSEYRTNGCATINRCGSSFCVWVINPRMKRVRGTYKKHWFLGGTETHDFTFNMYYPGGGCGFVEANFQFLQSASHPIPGHFGPNLHHIR